MCVFFICGILDKLKVEREAWIAKGRQAGCSQLLETSWQDLALSSVSITHGSLNLNKGYSTCSLLNLLWHPWPFHRLLYAYSCGPHSRCSHGQHIAPPVQKLQTDALSYNNILSGCKSQCQSQICGIEVKGRL